MIKNSKRVYISSENCSLCGHCFAICPVGAIEIFGMSSEQLKLDMSNLNDLENIIAYRRSIRKYEPEPLPTREIDSLLQFLKFSPQI
jgi:Fe-S-cluster-containing hydrogenase component 2